MSYIPSQVVCNGCGKQIDQGEHLVCWECYRELERQIEDMGKEIALLRDELHDARLALQRKDERKER